VPRDGSEAEGRGLVRQKLRKQEEEGVGK
jgi:hypothetical protein